MNPPQPTYITISVSELDRYTRVLSELFQIAMNQGASKPAMVWDNSSLVITDPDSGRSWWLSLEEIQDQNQIIESLTV